MQHLEEMLYNYNPEVSALITQALIGIVYQKEAETLLQRRSDLFVFKQVQEPVPLFFQNVSDMSERELFVGFAVDRRANISATEYINGNVKLFLKFFKNSFLFPIVEKEVKFPLANVDFRIIILNYFYCSLSSEESCYLIW